MIVKLLQTGAGLFRRKPQPLDFTAYNTTADWFQRNSSQIGAAYVRLREPEEVVNRMNYPDFGYNYNVMQWEREIFPAVFAAVMPGARLWFRPWQPNAVFAADGNPVSDLIFRLYNADEFYRDGKAGKWRLPKPLHLRGTIADLTCLGDGKNYCHWLLDCLPKIHVLREAGLFSSIDKFLVNALTPFVTDTLEVFNISPDRIISLEQTGEYLSLEKFVALSPLTSAFRPRWIFEFLQKAFTRPVSETRKKRLYISRGDAPTRRVLNDAEVFTALKPLGFEKILMNGLSVREQAALFAEAGAIVASHGAALANLAFCKTGTTVVECFPSGYSDMAYWGIASRLDLAYACLAFPAVEGDPKHADFNIDPARLAETLAALGIRR
ncbi:MAG: glycosyltransferase family 61 protein [Methylacidiphilales bacterium]|nr:glycosyltransferase family 61 protein [Candidatus Methylacidiphilales bacterium]